MKKLETLKSSKRVKKNITSDHEETIDYISELPDSLLVHILSFLPIRDAIKTIVLRRFGNLWRSIRVLDLTECPYHECFDDDDDDDDDEIDYMSNPGHSRKFSRVIHHVSNLHDVGILDKLVLKFYFPIFYSNEELNAIDETDFGDSAEWEKATAGDIEKLVDSAIKRKVKVLDLNFKSCVCVAYWELYTLPFGNVIRSSNYLTNLKLTCCDIKYSCTTIIDLKVLRVLFLENVFLSDQAMENILLGCPLLEDLSLVHCYGLGKLDCKNPNLKKLMLNLDPREECLAQVSCPHVMSLEIAEWLVGAELLDVSSLIDASISYCSFFKIQQRVYDGFQSLMQKISSGRTINLCKYTLLTMSMWNLGNVPCASYGWKNLIIELYTTKWHHPGLCWLLKSCRSIKTLTLHIKPDKEGQLPVVALEFSSRDFEGERYWDFQDAIFISLECVIVHGYVNEPYIDQFLKFLLRNATKLQKMEISIKGILEANNRCEVMRLVQELLAFPKASSQLEICVSC